jgi:plastocyanin
MPTDPALSSFETVNAPTYASSGRGEVLVNIHDACDPDTFNAVLGPGMCVRAGGVKFDDFIAQLTRLTFVGSWHFAPPRANATVGQTFVVINRGGEVHTFTEVEEFGGGVVPALNDLAKVPAVAPECTALEDEDRIKPGASYREDIEDAGVEKYQCCIHPWMRLEARVSNP